MLDHDEQILEEDREEDEQILRLYADGVTVRGISEALELSENEVLYVISELA